MWEGEAARPHPTRSAVVRAPIKLSDRSSRTNMGHTTVTYNFEYRYAVAGQVQQEEEVYCRFHQAIPRANCSSFCHLIESSIADMALQDNFAPHYCDQLSPREGVS